MSAPATLDAARVGHDGTLRLGVKDRRLRELEIIQGGLLVGGEERAQDGGVDGRGDVPVIIAGDVTRFMRGFDAPFGPRDQQIGKTPKEI